MTSRAVVARAHRILRKAPLLLVLALGGPAIVHGGDFSSEPFGLRLTLALDRGSAFTDVVALSASTAYPYLSSVNPAAIDFLRESPNDYTLLGTGTGTLIAFSGGATATAGAVSGSYRPSEAGTFLVTYTRIDSHDGTTHQGDTIALRANEVRLSYGHRLTRQLALGVGLRLSESTLSVASTTFDFPLRTETESLGIEPQVGLLIAPVEQWFIGAVAALGWTRSRTAGWAEFPAPPFADGPIRVAFTDNTRSINFRLGGGWQPSDKIGVYVDGQYLSLRNELKGSPTQSVEVGRGFAGLEYLPISALALRLGAGVDTAKQVSVSTGLGVYPARWLLLELAYVYNAFPEIRKEFGQAHRISLSIAAVF